MTGPSARGPERPSHPGWVWDEEDHTLVDLDPVRTWEIDLERSQRAGQTERVERLQKVGPPPGAGPFPHTFAPVILDFEVGGDPGGAVAIALAGSIERLRLVIVLGGQEAARFTRHLLDLMGRNDVAVVASSAPSILDQSIAGLTPPSVPNQPNDVATAIRSVTAQTPYLIQWGNHGPLTDLAHALHADPGLADRLSVSVGAGPLDTLLPHFASDPVSAAHVISHVRPVHAYDPRAAVSPAMTPAVVTAPANEVTIAAGSLLQQWLVSPEAPPWARLLGQYMQQWFATGHATSSQAAAVVIASVMRRPFIAGPRTGVIVDETGRLKTDKAGNVMDTTRTAQLYGFPIPEWILKRLRERASVQGASGGWGSAPPV